MVEAVDKFVGEVSVWGWRWEMGDGWMGDGWMDKWMDALLQIHRLALIKLP